LHRLFPEFPQRKLQINEVFPEWREFFNAVERVENMWNITVDKEKCNGCGECVEGCPGEVYELVDGKAMPVNLDECHGCHTCEALCAAEAITVEDE